MIMKVLQVLTWALQINWVVGKLTNIESVNNEALSHIYIFFIFHLPENFIFRVNVDNMKLHFLYLYLLATFVSFNYINH